MDNIEIIETGFNALCEAYANGGISFSRSALYSDLYFHKDNPRRNHHRFTYVSMNDNREIIAMCAFVLSLETGTTDSGWYVREDYRGKGIGKRTVDKAFNEFKNGVKSTGAKRLVIGATIDEGNAPSISLGRTFIGGEEVIEKADGSVIYSYLDEIQF